MNCMIFNMIAFMRSPYEWKNLLKEIVYVHFFVFEMYLLWINREGVRMKIYKIGTIVGLIYTILMFITAVGVFLYWIKKGINWTIFTEDKYRLLLLIGVIVCYMVSLITLAILLYILHIGKSVEEDW